MTRRNADPGGEPSEQAEALNRTVLAAESRAIEADVTDRAEMLAVAEFMSSMHPRR